MHEYDTVLKALLLRSANSIIEQIAGTKIVRWLNVELPTVQNTRVDLLGESTPDGEIIQIELQSANDPETPLRMAAPRCECRLNCQVPITRRRVKVPLKSGLMTTQA